MYFCVVVCEHRRAGGGTEIICVILPRKWFVQYFLRKQQSIDNIPWKSILTTIHVEAGQQAIRNIIPDRSESSHTLEAIKIFGGWAFINPDKYYNTARHKILLIPTFSYCMQTHSCLTYSILPQLLTNSSPLVKIYQLYIYQLDTWEGSSQENPPGPQQLSLHHHLELGLSQATGPSSGHHHTTTWWMHNLHFLLKTNWPLHISAYFPGHTTWTFFYSQALCYNHICSNSWADTLEMFLG